MKNKFNYDVVIVGGGISGAYLSHKLKSQGIKTVILEKSNTLGGRLSTKPVGSNLADYGCQYLNPKTIELKNLIETLEKKSLLYTIEIETGKQVYISPYGMNKIPQYLALGTPVIINELVKSIVPYKENSLTVITESLSLNTRCIVLTMPIAQVSTLLENSNIIINSLPKSYYEEFFTVTFLSEKSKHDKIIDRSKDLPWICNNTLKGLQNKENIFTVNFSDKISKELVRLSKEERVKKIKGSLYSNGFESINKISSHFWKYAYTSSQKNIDYIYDRKSNIGVCGDSFSVGQVDGAIKSSELIYKEIISLL